MEGADNPAKQPVGLVANHLHDEQQSQQDPQHGSVLGQRLPLFGAEEFSTEAVSV